MKIAKLSLRQVEIPLKVRFSQSNNATSISCALIFEVMTGSGIAGYGESCPRLYVTGESIESVVADVNKIRPVLKTQQLHSIDAIRELITIQLAGKVGLSTLCGLELALLDAWGKSHGVSVLNALGGQPGEPIPYSGIIPLASIDSTQKVLQTLGRFPFRNLKLKVDTDLDASLTKIAMIREAFPDAQHIRVDANCSWTYEEARSLVPALAEAGVNTFEQMFPVEKDEDMGKITREFGDQVSIMADESSTSFASARKLVEQKLCNRLNIKLSKQGGIFNALEIAALAKSHGLTCQLGAHFGETSLLTAAGVIFTSLAGTLSAIEGAFGTYLLESDITPNSIRFDQSGNLDPKNPAFSEPGLGVAIDPELVSHYTIRTF